MFELVDQALDGFGEIRHAESFVIESSVIDSSAMECGGPEEIVSLGTSAENTTLKS